MLQKSTPGKGLETAARRFWKWPSICNGSSVARYLTILLGVLLGGLILGSFGTFFWYVPLMPFAAAVTIMLGMVLMFILGVQMGGRRIRILRRKTIPR